MNSRRLILFLLGMFSLTEINLVGYIGVAELFCFAMGPLFFFMDYRRLKEDGFMTFLWLAVLMFMSGALSNAVNHAPIKWALRGLAAPYAIFAITCTLYHFLRDNIMDCRWLFAGFAVSTTLCVFVLQPGNVRGGIDGTGGAEAVQRAVEYSLFWLNQLRNWLTLPIFIWYRRLAKPLVLTIAGFLLVFGFAFSNNRSSLISGGLTLLLLVVAGRNQRSMKFMRKHFWAVLLLSAVIAPVGNLFYKKAALSGYLGEGAQKKYIGQVERFKGNSGVLGTLVAGRAGTFAGLYAIIDRPILGHGAWAPDTKGYWGYFISKYGDAADIKIYNENRLRGRIGTIPAHSYVVCFWIWNGIGGGVMAIYMFYLLMKTLKNHMDTIPHLYGYFAFMIPPYLWAIFFSPFGRRLITVSLFVLCLFVRAAACRRFNPLRIGLVKGDPPLNRYPAMPVPYPGGAMCPMR